MRADIKIYEETLLKVIKYLFKSRIFNLLTKKSSGLFLRGKDIISVNPQIFGIHEEPLTNLIKHYVKNGYKDFLIDIGANIGLTSCQNGGDFTEVHMFEPNPLCCNILEVNAWLAFDSAKFNIYRYGLGESNKKCSLTVPKHNWGGAFIRDKNNSYSDNILASKDRFETIDSKNSYSRRYSITSWIF
jgi:FkbM family methyltransferase